MEEKYWKDNAREVPRTIRRRFIDARRIPARAPYKTAQRTLDTMSRLVRKLEATPRSPSPKDASVRCYGRWESMVSQMALNLATNASSMVPRH